MAMETFPLPYTFEIDKEITFATTEISFQSGKKQVQQNAVNPSIKWKIQCKGSNEDRQTLESFHGRMAGNTKVFYFTDENLVQRTVRFSEKTLSIKVIREFSTTNITHGTPIGFTSQITLEVDL